MLQSPLDCKKIKPVNPKINQPWIFIERTDAEDLILRPPDAKSWLIGKHPDAEKDWRQEENGVTEEEIVGWHQRLNGHEFEQTPEDSEGQGSLECCSSQGHRGRHDWGTEQGQQNQYITWSTWLYDQADPLKKHLCGDHGLRKISPPKHKRTGKRNLKYLRPLPPCLLNSHFK